MECSVISLLLFGKLQYFNNNQELVRKLFLQNLHISPFRWAGHLLHEIFDPLKYNEIYQSLLKNSIFYYNLCLICIQLQDM